MPQLMTQGIRYHNEAERTFAEELLKGIPFTQRNLPAFGCHSVIQYTFEPQYEEDFEAVIDLLDETFPAPL